jgi:hypothetical protein
MLRTNADNTNVVDDLIHDHDGTCRLHDLQAVEIPERDDGNFTLGQTPLSQWQILCAVIVGLNEPTVVFCELFFAFRCSGRQLPVWRIDDQGCPFHAPAAKTSTWVNHEIELALNFGKRVFPALVYGDDASAVPAKLTNVQRVDIGNDMFSGMRSLGVAIRQHLSSQAPLVRRGQHEE